MSVLGRRAEVHEMLCFLWYRKTRCVGLEVCSQFGMWPVSKMAYVVGIVF